MADKNLNTPIWQLTIGEFLELHDTIQHPVLTQDYTTQQNRRYVYGMTGLANLFGCSKRHANTIKASGKIDKAIVQTGRKIIIDADLALELCKQ